MDTNFGGEVDVVDYGVGRATFTGNFESVLGTSFALSIPTRATTCWTVPCRGANEVPKSPRCFITPHGT
jgi:hypothetical protein